MRTIYLLVFVLALARVGSSVGRADDRPHAMFIAVDDLNDWISCYDTNQQTKTPNLERFAETARVFDNAPCAFPLCNHYPSGY